MNYRKIKFKIAQSCNGDLKEYFNKVNLINKIIIKKRMNSMEQKNIHKVINS